VIYNGSMKTLLLTLVGVVGLTGVSFGQTNAFNIPWTIDGYNFAQPYVGQFWTDSVESIDASKLELGYTHWYGQDGEYPGIGNPDGDPEDPFVRWPGHYAYEIYLGKLEDGTYKVQLISYMDPNIGHYTIELSGQSLEDLSVDSIIGMGEAANGWGVFGPPTPHNIPSPINFLEVEGVGENFLTVLQSDFPQGFPSRLAGGGMNNNASGGAFVEQAKELNVGLVFQDGQWTPAP